jgi:parvulin-like peptidyl-prolyl isomerase
MTLSFIKMTFLALCACFVVPQAFSAATIDDPGTVAVVNGYKLPVASVDLIYKSVSQGKRPMRYGDLVNGLIENRLLAEYAEEEIGAESLMSTSSVGFPIGTYLDDQYTGLIQSSFHETLSTYIKKNIGESPKAITTFNFKNTKESLQKTLDLGKSMEYKLNDAQIAEAKQIAIAQYKIPGEEEQAITLYDLYERQNVQGRIKFHQLNLDYISTQIIQFVSSRAVNWWAEKYSGLSLTEIEALKRFIADKHYKMRVIKHHGMSNDIHDDNPVLDKEFKNVTQAEISQYYEKNKEKFRRIEYVEARHIRLANQDDATKVQAVLEDGLDFSDAAAKYSIAESKKSSPAGSLGRITAEKGGSNWAKSAVFALPEGTASRPIRSPQADGKTVYWEIFLVDKRKQNYFDEKSETVRYLAGKEVARKHLEQRFLETRKKLFENADVKLNPALVNK